MEELIKPNKIQPLRVLEVIRQGDVGGGESHVLDLVLGFDRTLVTPIVMAFTKGKMIDALRAAGITCYVIETTRPFDHRVQHQIHDVILEERIQLIHAHGSRAASNIFWLAYRAHLPLVYTVHGWSFHPDQPRLTFRLRAWSEALICHFTNRVICVSESNRLSGVNAFGLQDSMVIENGINLSRFDADTSYPDVRSELGFSGNDYVVALIARITKQKGPMHFVKSVALAHQSDPRVKGLIVGDGDMKEEMMAYIRQEGLEEVFKVTPFRQDVPALLKAIDVYCLPSLWEGLSIALIEAMAMKKPLVVTPTDGTREIITHKRNGWVVPFEDDQALATAYLTLKEQPALAATMGEAAQTIVKRRFDSRRVSRSVMEVYREVINHR
jgi:glycosyltransferase involved in cell wall biosynthesis